MISVRFFTGADGGFHLRMRGHAGAGPKGRDLVCAGASTLAFALGRAAEHLEAAGLLSAPARVRLREGEAEISALPRQEFRQETALVFWTVQVGMHELAAAHPARVVLDGVIRLEEETSHD